jgi:hypothetical protein
MSPLSQNDRKAQILSSGRVPSSDPETGGVQLPQVDIDGNLYTPNHIPRSERGWNTFLSLLLVAYGTFGVWVDDIAIPGKRNVTHFHGVSAWLLYLAMLCGAANLMSVVVDHYDTRNNVHNYKLFARVTQVLGWGLVLAAMAASFFLGH